MRPLRKPLLRDYEIGYGRPPAKSRFGKGVSGNPRGRPRRMTPARAKRLALEEAYKLITVGEGDGAFKLPAIQLVMRQQIRLAAKGNGPAQRAVIAMIQAIEQEAMQAATGTTEANQYANMTDQELARALATFLARTKHRYLARGPSTPKRDDDSDDDAS